MKQCIAFFPYSSIANDYTVKMEHILKRKYQIVDYLLAREGTIPLSNIAAVYLNWKENEWSLKDESFLLEAQKQGVKIIWVFHNRIPHDTSREEREQKICLLKKIIRLADDIIIHSKNSITYLQDYFPEISLKKIHYLPHTHYCGMYGHFGGDIRERFDIGKEEFVFALFGALRPYKNIELLIDVFKELNLPNGKLLICGAAYSVEYYESLKAKIKNLHDVIIQNEYISDMAMASYLDAIDVMVLPYNPESSMNSGAMMLAFSYGKSVVISDIAMAKDFDTNLFYLYEAEDCEGAIKKNLAAKMLEAYNNGREQNSKLGRTLQGHVRTACSDAILEEKLAQILEKAVEQEHLEHTSAESELERHIEKENNLRFLLRTTQQWWEADRKQKRISVLLKEYQVKTVAIYGMGKLGRLLYQDLTEDGIDVLYAIDKNSSLNLNIPIYIPDEKLEKVDVVIVTVKDFLAVKVNLAEKMNTDIIHISDLMKGSFGEG